MAQFRYKHVGDSRLLLEGKLVKPGEEIERDEEIINGNFEPANEAAVAAKAKRDEEEGTARAAHELSLMGTGAAPELEPEVEAAKPKRAAKPKEA
jgi:hypothetical protein